MSSSVVLVCALCMLVATSGTNEVDPETLITTVLTPILMEPRTEVAEADPIASTVNPGPHRNYSNHVNTPRHSGRYDALSRRAILREIDAGAGVSDGDLGRRRRMPYRS